MHSAARQFEGMHADHALIAHYAMLRGPRSVFGETPKIVVAVPELKAGGSVSITTLIIAGMTLLSTGGALATPTSSKMSPWAVDQFLQSTVATGYRRKQDVAPSEMLADIRLRLGLTWSQVASLFDVSRRAVHAWASGERLNDRHDVKLRELHARLIQTSDLPALKHELVGNEPAPREHVTALKGAILSSDELGISIQAKAPTRRIPTAQLRRR